MPRTEIGCHVVHFVAVWTVLRDRRRTERYRTKVVPQVAWSNIFILSRESAFRHPLGSQRRQGLACLPECSLFLAQRLLYQISYHPSRTWNYGCTVRREMAVFTLEWNLQSSCPLTAPIIRKAHRAIAKKWLDKGPVKCRTDVLVLQATSTTLCRCRARPSNRSVCCEQHFKNILRCGQGKPWFGQVQWSTRDDLGVYVSRTVAHHVRKVRYWLRCRDSTDPTSNPVDFLPLLQYLPSPSTARAQRCWDYRWHSSSAIPRWDFDSPLYCIS